MTEPLPMNGDMRTSYRDILVVAVPLMLTMSLHVAMQFIDAIFLAWYSPAAMAAVAPAGMAVWMLVSAFNGTAGYTSVFAAQYVGANRAQDAAPVVWQGVYFSAVAGLVVAASAALRGPLFDWVGHDPAVRAMEGSYFGICALGGPAILVSSALAGFFSGQRRTGTLMVVHGSGMALNAVLDYLLIFGKAGLPRMGMAGAAWATVAAHVFVAVALASLFLAPRARREFGTWAGRAFDASVLWRLMRYGFPHGSRFTIEMLAWTAFLFFVGRIGVEELASTNIAWRINGIAFFPVVGLSQAVSILVGNAQGARRPDLSVRVTLRGLALTQAWMIAAGLLFLLFPEALYSVFRSSDPANADAFARMAQTGAVLLRFVALYCLMDGINIITVGALQAAGDTRWTLVVSVAMHLAFIAVLWGADRWHVGLMGQWALATAFVLVQGFAWVGRFLAGRWKTIELID